VAGCGDCGDEPSGSCATELAILLSDKQNCVSTPTVHRQLTWQAFKNVTKSFLEDHKAENYNEIVSDLLTARKLWDVICPHT
jgi:hypothetical protein